MVEVLGMAGYGIFVGVVKSGLPWYYPAGVATMYIMYSAFHEGWAFQQIVRLNQFIESFQINNFL